jgi:hypothetical protein
VAGERLCEVCAGEDEPIVREPQAEPSLVSSWQLDEAGSHSETSDATAIVGPQIEDEAAGLES